MTYMIDQSSVLATSLEKFTTADAYQVAGLFANLEFWMCETIHALDVLEKYSERFDRLSNAQARWIAAHDVVVGSFCPACNGRCEFQTELQRPRAPTRIPSSAREEAIRRLRDATYYFLRRGFRMHLIDESEFRAASARIGTSVDPRDLAPR